MVPLDVKHRPTIHLLKLENLPILEQLRLEEALLRVDTRSWCLLNHGSTPAIVLGISGKIHEMVAYEQWQHNPIPLIRRFSGGGTVVIDADTCFTTFIGQAEELDVPAKIEAVHHWAVERFKPIFPLQVPFHLRENDYAIGNRKCGGNAQYFARGRWLHHTSFLWDYTSKHMQLLALPPKMPNYRERRGHEEFLCCLKDYFISKELFQQRLIEELSSCFTLIEVESSEVLPLLEQPHRKATQVLHSVIS